MRLVANSVSSLKNRSNLQTGRMCCNIRYTKPRGASNTTTKICPPAIKKVESVMTTTRFGYFFTTNGTKRPGYITVALTRPSKDETDQKHLVSFAFCSPKDVFSKTKGRLIAEGRINTGRIMELDVCGTVPSVIKTAMEKAIADGLVPSWVAKAHKRNKLSYGLSQKAAQKAAETK